MIENNSNKKKSILITGSAKRIGRIIALYLAKNGYEIIIHANNSIAEANSLANEIKQNSGLAQIIIGDLSDNDFVAKLISQAQNIALNPLFALINNASIFENDSARDFNDAQLQEQMNINLFVPLKLARDFYNILNGQTGHIINILDQRVLKPNPYFFTYNLSKMGLASATKTMAQEFAPNIRVNAIAPGPSIKNIRQSTQDFEKQCQATILGTGSPPQEIAKSVLFILEANSITGQIIAVDGGQHLTWQTPDIEGINE
jgi:NAD(P)-dependent dehydrogenase (short-subunit alcohol dehydrogenase family)